MNDKTLPETIAIVKNDKGVPVVTSIEVAERFDRRHADVMNSIDRIVNQEVSTERYFSFSKYLDKSGRSIPFCIMDRTGFSLLAMGFTGAVALKWKVSFIEAFDAMERELTRRQEVNLDNPETLRGLLLDYSEKVIALQGEVVELKPDAESMRLLRSAEGAVTMTAVAKMLDVKRNWLFNLMREEGWFYWQNGTHLPYATAMKAGLLTVDPGKGKAISRSSGAVQLVATTLITPKGLAKITEIVKARIASDIKAAEENVMNEIRGEDDQDILNEIRHDDAVYGHDD